MGRSIAPRVGDWYRYADGRLFEVVALDEQEDTIETQHFDGTVEELDGDGWLELEPQAAQPPEDWAGSMDVQKEDYGVEYDDSPHRQWLDPLDFLDTDFERSTEEA